MKQHKKQHQLEMQSDDPIKDINKKQICFLCLWKKNVAINSEWKNAHRRV